MTASNKLLTDSVDAQHAASPEVQLVDALRASSGVETTDPARTTTAKRVRRENIL